VREAEAASRLVARRAARGGKRHRINDIGSQQGGGHVWHHHGGRVPLVHGVDGHLQVGAPSRRRRSLLTGAHPQLPLAAAATVVRTFGRSPASMAWLRALSLPVPQAWELREEQEANDTAGEARCG
jgi:hypothetical protein